LLGNTNGRRPSRREIEEAEAIDRLTWQMPPLETLARPVCRRPAMPAS
jgi:hypothetical protein